MQTEELVGKYRILTQIGSGANGSVHKAIDRTSGHIVAIKQIPKEHLPQEQHDLISNEKRVLSGLRHPNVIGFRDFVEKQKSLNLVLEYMEGGSISQIIEKLGPLDEDFSKIIIKQMLLGLQYLHEKGIVHRDIKVWVWGKCLIRQSRYAYF